MVEKVADSNCCGSLVDSHSTDHIPKNRDINRVKHAKQACEKCL